jgi:hypothetical protein
MSSQVADVAGGFRQASALARSWCGVGRVATDHPHGDEDPGRAEQTERDEPDGAVALLVLPFSALVAMVACRAIARRFGADERVPRAVATAVVAALAGAIAFRLWGGVWEAIRVDTGHMTTIRAASSSAWGHTHAGIDVAAGLLVFWLVAAIDAARAYKSGPPGAPPG